MDQQSPRYIDTNFHVNAATQVFLKIASAFSHEAWGFLHSYELSVFFHLKIVKFWILETQNLELFVVRTIWWSNTFNHLNTGLMQYSGVHCMELQSLNQTLEWQTYFGHDTSVYLIHSIYKKTIISVKFLYCRNN